MQDEMQKKERKNAHTPKRRYQPTQRMRGIDEQPTKSLRASAKWGKGRDDSLIDEDAYPINNPLPH